MKRTILLILAIATVITFTPGCGPSARLPVAERRVIVSDMETETLERLYRESPGTKNKIKKLPAMLLSLTPM